MNPAWVELHSTGRTIGSRIVLSYQGNSRLAILNGERGVVTGCPTSGYLAVRFDCDQFDCDQFGDVDQFGSWSHGLSLPTACV